MNSKGDWKLKKKVTKAAYSNMPVPDDGHMPKDISYQKYVKHQYLRTHPNGGDLYKDDPPSEEDDENVLAYERHVDPWKAATKSEEGLNALRSELLRTDKESLNYEEHGSTTSLVTSLENMQELKQYGTINSQPVTVVPQAISGARPATSASFSVLNESASVPAPPVNGLLRSQSSHPTTVGGFGKLKPEKKLIRTALGYIDTTSNYAKYKLANADNNVTLDELNRNDYENDDSVDND